jgi:hypothetical protein
MPGDFLAAAPRPSAVERERVAGRLREACADERLSLDSFIARLELVYAARTRAELRRLVADIQRHSLPGRALLELVRGLSSWSAQLAAAWREPRLGRLVLPGAEVTVGRSRHCGCVLTDETVSRRHAVVSHEDGTWWLRDLGSTNGTFVNGLRVTGETEVMPGDEVTFGDASFVLDTPDRRSRRA